MFENIEKFYIDNHYRLIEDKLEGALRPGKSFTKDVENCLRKFLEFYTTTGFVEINEERLVSIIGGVDTNTRSQNLRVMREFGFLVETDVSNEDGMLFLLTDSFKEFIASGETPRVFIFDKLKSVSSIEDLSMYLNLIICTLREAYLYGQVILFKDSYDKFKLDVPDLAKRNEYRERIYKVYGYSGRDNQITDDVYSPNLSYMSRAELENLGLLIMTTQKIDNMNNLVLTTKGYELLCCIDKNLGKKNAEENVLKNKTKYERNRILFGAPGTGKSFTLNKEKDELLADGGESERVTFHPDYSYANFVGTYKPTMLDPVNDFRVGVDEKDVISTLLDKSKTAQEKYNLLYNKFKEDGLTRLPILLGLYTDESFKTLKKDGTEAAGDNSVEKNHGRAIRPYVNLITDKKYVSEIAYEYVPGPFMRTLVKALKNCKTDNPKPFLLIIEEINRANMAAVFGDVFQLLDRDDKQVSEYPIQASEDIKKYLAKELGGLPNDYSEIRIPDNIYIWATMNSADQGVFPMDTAFKRRWDFTYLGIDDSEAEISGKTVEMGTGSNKRIVEWNELRKAINAELSSYKVNEDKLLGPYFLSKKIIPETEPIDPTKFIATFKSKVIMYLFDDAAKQKRQTLFDGCTDKTKYSSICKEFDSKGVFIFSKNISDKFPAPTADTTEDGAE